MIDLTGVKERLRDATPGLWSRPTRGSSIYSNNGEDLTAETWECEDSIDDAAPDADLIAHAPGDLAALVAEVERLRVLAGEIAPAPRCGGCRGLGGHRVDSPACEFYQDPLTCTHPSWTGEDNSPLSHDGYALWWRCDSCGLVNGPR